MPKKYNEIIRGLREDHDLKQVDIANILGTSQQHYSKYEKGEYELPIRALVILADYYKVSADYLLGRTDCTQGLDSLKIKITPKQTVGGFISSFLALSNEGRYSVIEYMELQKLKESKSNH